ncbi:DASH complex, subunit Dad1 [Moelleriella libera RCEF 2490]|uniref:DASH complex subunit DAD1 n=1 Tax=Moelleriella libera RCEF 2490 TaxID=1081109 RepID=A0A162IUR8_9HYPO|nr:DASH complex, subunit Dad1 [Moelleriella libera RCEF 2490]
MAKRQRTADDDQTKTYFEQQREALLADISLVCFARPPFLPNARCRSRVLHCTALHWTQLTRRKSMDNVLGNINKLNRSLEEIIKMGNDLSSVEALWSQFENVMAKGDENGPQQQQPQQQGGEKTQVQEKR